METKQSRQHRLNPSKLLVLILYGTYPYMDVSHEDQDMKRVSLGIGKFAKLMRVRNKHIVEYLEWLDQMNFITLVKTDRYRAELLIHSPTLFKEDVC